MTIDGMDQYEITLRDNHTDNRWTMMFWADDFGHAEEQAKDHLESTDDHSEIISIKKELK